MNNWLKTAHNLAYPYVCAVCLGADCDGMDLCRGCRAELPRLMTACRRCALALPEISTGLCGQCQADPPEFHEALVPYQYSQPVDRLIQGLKFNARLSYARVLGQLLVDVIRDSGCELPECLIPVPLHPKRLRERGFNQSLVIANLVAQQLRITLNDRSVIRTRYTKPQMGLPARARRKNIRGAFMIRENPSASRVAILDDVMTTGNTMRELAKMLSGAGVTHIQVWCAARA